MAKYSTRDIVVTFVSNKGSLSLKNLHFEAEIVKTLSATPNVCNLTVYNMKQSSRDFLTSVYNEEVSTFTVEVVLDNVSIFKGDIVNATSLYVEGTWTTSVYGNEGYNASRKSATVESKKGDTRADILDSLFDTLKDSGMNAVDIQALKNGCGEKSILKRVLYEGNVIENIKKLIKDCLPDADTFIDGDKLGILPNGSTVANADEELSSFLEPPQLNEQGCRAVLLLNNALKIGGKMTLKAKSYNRAFGNLTTNRARKSAFSGEGTYKIIEIAHSFDNNSNKVAQTHVTGVFLS
jgi:hypothetical protein